MGWELGKKRAGKSRFVGVCATGRKAKPWRAMVRVNGRLEHRGMFVTEEDAARAYDRAARAVYGERAVLNFPE